MALYVTDTHPLLWYLGGRHRRLSKKARAIFDDAVNQRSLVYIPVGALWEIGVLLKVGRISLREPFGEWLGLLSRLGFDFAPIDVKVVEEARYLSFNRDPFDAVIVATAKLRELPLITKDLQIADSQTVDIAW